MFISIPHEVNYLTESDKNIPEPLLRASKKSFAPPQSFHFLFRSLREILCYPTACNYNSGMYSLENTRQLGVLQYFTQTLNFDCITLMFILCIYPFMIISKVRNQNDRNALILCFLIESNLKCQHSLCGWHFTK